MGSQDWQQDDLLQNPIAPELGLELASSQRVLVITHDCDLLRRGEPWVEVMFAGPPSGTNFFANLVNPRRLHLPYTGGLRLELRQDHRCCLLKELFETHAQKDPDHSLAIRDKRVLKQWLAARYGRSAFPDAFESRLRGGIKDFQKVIDKTIKPKEHWIRAIFFDLKNGRHSELQEGVPYDLEIHVVYKTKSLEGDSIDPAAAAKAAENLAKQMNTLFKQAFGDPRTAQQIALHRCRPIAEDDITLAELHAMDQWRAEHLSSADDFVKTGELPP